MPLSTAVPKSGADTLRNRIGEYVGYENASLRKSSDAAIRRHLITSIKDVLQQLESPYQAADTEDQERLDSLLKSTKRKLNTICQSLNHPTYQQVSFFSGKRLSDREISRIYNLEQEMIEEIDHVQTEVAGMGKEKLEREIFEDHFLHISNFLDNVNQSLFEREALILGDV
ncbi:MAG: hypothetical protein EHM72_09380 [Calditrichaeota bacterium]|nr:MAG: hypothetical protein EHM72_09380 [Calditrichota bacterium]